MKKLMINLALLMGSAFCVNAQSTSTAASSGSSAEHRKHMDPEERAHMESARAEKQLSLTADQKSQWDAAAKKRAEANRGPREKMKGSTTPEERKKLREEVRNNNKAFDSTVETFLTAEQKAKYDEDKKQRMGKRPKGTRQKNNHG